MANSPRSSRTRTRSLSSKIEKENNSEQQNVVNRSISDHNDQMKENSFKLNDLVWFVFEK